MTVLVAGGALFVKYKLELLRSTIQLEAEARTKAKMQVGSVVVNGLRGLRIDGFEVAYAMPSGPEFRVNVPQAVVDIDIVDLLSGRVSIDRIQLDGATILISRAPDAQWFSVEPADLPGAPASGASDDAATDPADSVPFRVAGAGCTLEVANVVGNTRVMVDGFDFDVSRLPSSPDITAKLAGNLGADPAKRIQLKLWYTSLEDFDLRVECAGIAAEDVNVFLPASQRFVETGATQPNLRVAGYPDKTMVLSLEAPFQDITVRDQPEFLGPVTGSLRALASYDLTTQTLSLITAQARSRQLGGVLDGSISFTDAQPVFDLRLQADELPVTDILAAALDGRVDEYGTLDLTLDQPYSAEIDLTGTSESPVIQGFLSVDSGAIAFVPKDENLPRGQLTLGRMKIAWDSASEFPAGVVNVVDGAVDHLPTKSRAERISGVVNLADRRLTCEPLHADITGNPFVARLEYDLASASGKLSLDGKVSNLEDTFFGSALKDFSMAGSVALQCEAELRDNCLTVDGEVDATQAQVNLEWWLRKPIGIGANAKKVHVEFRPKDSVKITADTVVASTPITMAYEVVHEKDGDWPLDKVRCDSDLVNLTALGTCFNVPYTISGGTATKMFLAWDRMDDYPQGETIRVGGLIDNVDCLPDGGTIPIHCKEADLLVTMDNGPKERLGTVKLRAAQGDMPPLGEIWFLPLNPKTPEEEAREKEQRKGTPDRGEKWLFDLATDAISMPPWKGTNFKADVYEFPDKTGLNRFEADLVGGGRLVGSYHTIKADNHDELTAEWTGIPATYLTEHLKYAHALVGTATGKVRYTVDRDDPDTLRGEGYFDIRDGEFGADFLLTRFGAQFDNDMSALPPSLKFSKFRADVELDGDVVRTPKLELVSPGITVDGSGQYADEGDMTYALRVSIAPETAERIPALANVFNVQGLRLAQQNVELAFRIDGPAFNPRSEVAELPPVGVTLMSGALEVTSEAIKFFDMPRRILVDLLKTGGGIVAATNKQ